MDNARMCPVPNWDFDPLDVKVLVGKQMIRVDKFDRAITFETTDGDVYVLFHDQECCEDVYIEDVVGDLSDLTGSPLVMSECVSVERVEHETPLANDHYTWTFYKFATVKGYITVRWYGESNGYYSESVDFCKLSGNEQGYMTSN